MTELRNHIKDLRDETGLSQTALAQECGWYGKTRLSKLENGEQIPDALDLDTLSRVFSRLLKRRVYPQDIVEFSLRSAVVQNVHTIRVIAPVQAGQWRESFEYPEDLQEVIHIPDNLANLPFFAVRVVGDSVNLQYPDGTILLCLPPDSLSTPPKTSDFVVVQRIRDGEYESTVKMLHLDEKKQQAILMPRSSNPEHHTPIVIPWGPISSARDERIEIVGVVIKRIQMTNEREI